MSFSMAACDLTAMEVSWLDKSHTGSLFAAVPIGPSRRRGVIAARAPPTPALTATATIATITSAIKRQRLLTPRWELSIAHPSLPHSPAPIAPVEQLSSALLTAIGPFLTVREKLLHLTRLSRSFPSLTPACFRRDEINLNSTLIDTITASRRNQQLFSQVQSLSFIHQQPRSDEHGNEGEKEKANGIEPQLRRSIVYQQLAHLLRPSSSPTPSTSVFPALSSLTLVVGPQLSSSLCHSLFVSLSALVNLSKLYFATHEKDAGERVTSVALAELRHCHSLRHLTLSNHAIDHRTFVLLCTLPLSYLDLSGTKLVRALSSDVTSPTSSARLVDSSAQCFGSAWSAVLLPKAKQEADEEVIDEVLSAYFQRVDAHAMVDDDSGCASSQNSSSLAVLEYLNCNSQISSGVFSSLASLTSLTTLDLDGVRVNADMLEVSPLFTPSLAPRLPHLVHFISPRNYRDDSEKQLQQVNQSYISFLVVYSSQLRTLRLKIPYTCLCVDVVNAVFKCHQLRRLTLKLYSYAHSEENDVETPELPATPAIPLLHLHFLKLHGLPLTDTGLAALLRACPNVEHLKLAKSDMLTMDGLEAVGMLCPLLRLLTIKSCELVLASSERDSLGLQCEPSGKGYVMSNGSVRRIFPSLAILSIVNYAEGGGVTDYSPLDYSPSNLRLLVSLLCCSPVAYLCLHVDLAPSELAIFQPLTRLRFLRASNTLPDPLHRYFSDRLDDETNAMPSVKSQRLLSEERVGEDEMRRSWLVKARVAESPSLFVSDAAFEGLTGREAFFKALMSEHHDDCDECAGAAGERQGDEEN